MKFLKRRTNHDREQTFSVSVAEQAVRGRYVDGSDPVGVFVHGFRSHADGTKARALARYAVDQGSAWVRFDLRGCGQSEGTFDQFTISGAVADTLAILDWLAPRPVILVGSSLGGLVAAVAAAQRRPETIRGLLLVAPAFGLVGQHFATLPAATLSAWASSGRWRFPDRDNGGEYDLDYGFYRDALDHYRFDQPVHLPCPVVILHGERDEILPVVDSERFVAQLDAPAKELIVIPGGGHRLNDAIDLMCEQVERLRQAPPS